MKLFKLLLNTCSIAFLLNSCSNNNTSPTNAPAQNQSFSVSIDGVPYTATSFNASKNAYTSSNGTIVQSYSISGNLYSGTGGKTVNVQFFESPTNTYTTNSSNSSTGIGTGSFGYISDITAALSNTFSTVNQSLTPTVVGQIAVSSNNSATKTISGTFSGTIYKNNQAAGAPVVTKSFTNGVFTNIVYTVN